jgi:hypothetical protein
MPYNFLREKKRIPRNLDRRVRITPTIKAKIIKLAHEFPIENNPHHKPWSIHQISKITGISRRAIQFILYPERLLIVKDQFKERRKDGRYYNKKTWAATIREHRAYKQSIKDKLI